MKLDCDCCKSQPSASTSVIELVDGCKKNSVNKLCNPKAESPENIKTVMEIKEEYKESSFVSQLEVTIYLCF